MNDIKTDDVTKDRAFDVDIILTEDQLEHEEYKMMSLGWDLSERIDEQLDDE